MRHTLQKEYWEAPAAADKYRQAYADGIEAFLSEMNRTAEARRRDAFCPENQEENRALLRKMLGMELFDTPAFLPPSAEYAGDTDLAHVYRITLYITGQIPFYALLMLPQGVTTPCPLIIAQHGGGGTPELCSDLYGKNNYNHMVRRCLQRGAAVLAPQLLMWAQKEIETQRAHPIPIDRTKTDAALKRFGSSITALEITGIQRCLDYVSAMPEIDENRIGMVGLSYGGYFTLHTMALDTRIKAGYSAGAFNSRDKHCLTDWSYHSSAWLLQDAEIAALCAPRKLYIQVGMEDSVFDYRTAVTEAQQAQAYFAQLGAETSFQFDLWPGGHTLSDHDRGFAFLFDALQ